MSGKDRIAVFPSRANQVLIKQRTIAAARGANLLKRKRDAIDMKLRELRGDMQSRKDIADDLLREAIFSFAKANFLNTDFNLMRVANSDRADAFVIRRTQKIVGVTLPMLELIIRADAPFPLTGLGRGGGQVIRVRMLFQEALKNLISYASLEFTVRVLAVASRQNNMRVNALDHVVVPRLQNTHTYIRDELEEFEREDFYRLKRSQAKQLQAKLAFSNLIKKKNDETDELETQGRFSSLNRSTVPVNFDIGEFNTEAVKKRRTVSIGKSRINFEQILFNEGDELSMKELTDKDDSAFKPDNILSEKIEKITFLSEKVEKSNQTDFEEETGTQTDLSKIQLV